MRGSAVAMSPSGSASRIDVDQAQRLQRFVEAHRDARAPRRRRGCAARRTASASYGASGNRSADRRECPLARAANPRQAELGGQLARDSAAAAKAVLQAGMVVVDLAQQADLAIERARIASRISRRDVRCEIAARRRPGTTTSISRRWPNARQLRRSTSSFRRENCARPKRESAVIAEIAQVAQVVGNALALEAQRAQPRARAGASSRPAMASTACGVGPAVGDGAVAGNRVRRDADASVIDNASKRFSMPLCT